MPRETEKCVGFLFLPRGIRPEVAEEGEYPALRGKNDSNGQNNDFQTDFFSDHKKRPKKKL